MSSMCDHPTGPAPNFKSSKLDRIDIVCDEFEEEWLKNKRPEFAGFLIGGAEAHRPALTWDHGSICGSIDEH